jgi:tetratricopeptide (TPR) repeat protein
VVQLIILAALITNLKIPTQHSKLKTQNSNPQTPKLLLRLAALIAVILTPYIGHHTLKQYKGYKHWKEAYQLYQYQVYDDAAEEYLLAMDYLPDNGLLLQMYGKCLTMNKKWEEAREILEKAKQLRSDPILYTTLGDAYKTLKEYSKAENAYKHAWQMVPHKFYPGYLLAKLYDESDQKQKAAKIARELVNKKIKVDSKAIEEIKDELKRLIQICELSKNKIVS